MRYRDDYYSDRSHPEIPRNEGMRRARHRGDSNPRAGYICVDCGSNRIERPDYASARDYEAARARDRRDYERGYGHRDEFDDHSRMGIFDIPDAGYRRHERGPSQGGTYDDRYERDPRPGNAHGRREHYRSSTEGPLSREERERARERYRRR